MSSSEISSDESVLVSHRPAKSTKAKGRGKGKSRASAVVTPSGKDEGSRPFEPPPGYAPVEDVDAGEFDWDAVQADENLELWVIRVPDTIKPKYLQGLKLDVPSSSKTAHVGSIDRKSQTYDIWSLGDDTNDQAPGGEEVKRLSCLLPRQKKGGKLYQAPKPIARHLIVSARPTLPTPEASDASASASTSEVGSPVYKNPARPRYPAHLLKHRFMPMGSLAGNVSIAESVDVDKADDAPGTAHEGTSNKAKEKEQATSTAAPDVPAKKKRKTEGEGKRSKKAKASS